MLNVRKSLFNLYGFLVFGKGRVNLVSFNHGQSRNLVPLCFMNIVMVRNFRRPFVFPFGSLHMLVCCPVASVASEEKPGSVFLFVLSYVMGFPLLLKRPLYDWFSAVQTRF